MRSSPAVSQQHKDGLSYEDGGLGVKKKNAQVRRSLLARIDSVVTVFKTRWISPGKAFLNVCDMGTAALPGSPRRLLRSNREREGTL